MNVPVLHNGNCERLKAGAHAVVLGMVVVCGAYNLAAWLVRRQRHLAINTVLYAAAIVWEAGHVRHHLAECTPHNAKATPHPLRAAS
jgi:hypothetical protein